MRNSESHCPNDIQIGTSAYLGVQNRVVHNEVAVKSERIAKVLISGDSQLILSSDLNTVHSHNELVGKPLIYLVEFEGDFD